MNSSSARWVTLAFALFACTLGASSPAGAQRSSSEPRHRSGSRSIGRHNRGSLLSGRELVESSVIRLKTPSDGTHYGTDELVTLLEDAARTVAERFPGSRLTVGTLSRRRGGAIRRHRSHRSGRDVDVGFYIRDAEGNLLYLDRFQRVAEDGRVRAPDAEERSPHFDAERTWTFIAALLEQTSTPVQYVFIARWLEELLLEEAARVGASAELITRARVVLDQPRRGGRHDDHMHVRVYCAQKDAPQCVDEPPFHPWVERQGRAVAPRRVSRRRR